MMLFITLLLIPSASWAVANQAPVWVIDAEKPVPTEMSAYQTLWRDESGLMGIEDVIERLPVFQRTKNQIPSFGFTTDAIWSCMRMRSSVAQPVEMITRLDTARLSRVTWYLVDAQGRMIGSKESGLIGESAPAQRMPTFEWSLPPGEERWLFLRVQSDTSIWLPMQSGDADLMHARETRTSVLDAVLCGFCIAIAIFVIVTGYVQQSPMHLFLSSAVIGYVGYFAIFNGYIGIFWSNAPPWSERELMAAFLCTAVSSFSLFSRTFLSGKILKKHDRIIQCLAESLPLFGLIAVFAWEFSFAIQLVNLVILMSVLFGMLVAFRQGFPRGEQAWYLGGWGSLGFMMVWFGLQLSNMIPLIATFRELQLLTIPCLLVGFLVAVMMRQRANAAILQQRQGEKHAYEVISHISAGTSEVSLHPREDGTILTRFHFVSPQYLQMFDITEEELAAGPSSIYDRIHPDDREAWQKANARAIEDGMSFRWEGRLFWNGQTRWIQSSSKPRVNRDGITVWVGVITDITPQKQAQEALQRTLENLPVPIACDDMNHPPNITMINEQFVKTFGYSHEEIPTVADWALRAYPDPAYREEVMGWWFRAVQLAQQEKGKIESRELIVRCKDGTDKEIIISTTMLETGMILAIQDITERNRSARELEALRSSREKSAFELTENMPAGTYALVLSMNDQDQIAMHFRFISQRFLDFFGLTRAQVDQNPDILIEVFHPDDRESIIIANRNAYLTSQPFDWEGRTFIDGVIRWLSIQSNPRPDRSGIVVWEGVVTDITAHIQTQRQLENSLLNEKQLRSEAEQLRREAENAHEAKSLFLARMSHEIRTPLSALVSLSQAMWMRGEKHAFDPDFTPFLNRVRSGGQYLNLILRNVLNISAAESGRVPVKAGDFYVADWVADIQNILDPIAEYYRGHIDWRVPEDDEARWCTDQMRLTQIALNLCENALKYSQGQDQAVEFDIQSTESFLIMTVRDFGPGIPIEKQKSIFAAFSQLDRKISPLDEGVGLGLSVVKINTELLSGELYVENQQPCGMKFTIKIPRMAPTEPLAATDRTI